ncbi:MAG: c-type cytochrome [Burkholderiales bacterium]|nr:c-type cytochrome [Burkholderiales bacterium]
MSSEHDAFIKTPRQLITVVTLSFIVPILIIAALVSYVNRTVRTGAGSTAMTAESISLKSADGPQVLRAGEDVYKAQCAACHEVGAAGAPKNGDLAAWAPRIKTGYDALLTSALKGKNAMSAQGGGEYSDAEIGRAVVYMANKSGAKFAEPQALAAASAPTASAPTAAVMSAAAPAAVAAVANAASAVPAAAAAATTAATTAATAAATAVAAAAAPAAAKPAAASASSDAGKKVYDTYCAACHVAGVAGAPKFADKAAWAPRIATGMDALYGSVIKGKGAMPAKGGSPASDDDIKAAVQYMVAAAK